MTDPARTVLQMILDYKEQNTKDGSVITLETIYAAAKTAMSAIDNDLAIMRQTLVLARRDLRLALRHIDSELQR